MEGYFPSRHVGRKRREVQVYVDKVVQNLCSDKWEVGEFSMTFTGNLLVFGVKWEDGIDIYVTKDYWEDSIC